jgi:hypothetical protein
MIFGRCYPFRRLDSLTFDRPVERGGFDVMACPPADPSPQGIWEIA